MNQEIVIIRYGHRDVLDYRVTGHCGLVARAFGANKMIVCGSRDESIEKTITGVNEHWGKGLEVEYEESWRSAVTKLKKNGYKIVHLTMYGLPVREVEEELGKIKKIGVIIGSQKVERGVYEEANYNVAITSQPHSEIAALAVFLDRVQKGKELEGNYTNAKCKIIPQERGKKVINLKGKKRK